MAKTKLAMSASLVKTHAFQRTKEEVWRLGQSLRKGLFLLQWINQQGKSLISESVAKDNCFANVFSCVVCIRSGGKGFRSTLNLNLKALESVSITALNYMIYCTHTRKIFPTVLGKYCVCEYSLQRSSFRFNNMNNRHAQTDTYALDFCDFVRHKKLLLT